MKRLDELKSFIDRLRASPVLGSWKTTAIGVSMVLGGLADILSQFGTDSWDFGRLRADALAIAGGIGLIMAKDAK